MRIHNKLRSRGGETLTETLAAVLLVGLASVVLASMISAASRIRAQALERDEALYAEIGAAESRTGSGSPESVTVTVGGVNREFSITHYGEEGQLHSYAYRKGGGGA